MSLVHEALFYSTVDEFLEGTLRFANEALSAGEPLLIGVTEPRLDLLKTALASTARTSPARPLAPSGSGSGRPGSLASSGSGSGGSGSLASSGLGSGGSLASSGSVTFVDMAEGGLNPNRILPWVLRSFVESHPGRRVHIIGEPVYVGRRPEELGPCVQHEALINVAFADRNVRILCPYDTARLPHVTPYAERTHPIVVQGGRHRESRGYTDPHTVVALLNQPLPEPIRIEDTFAFDVRGLAQVRRVIAGRAEAAGLDEDRTGDLQLAVTEVATNAVTHPLEGSATLRVWSAADRFVCEIQSAGEIADIMAGRTIPAADSPRGRGLLVANRLCDLVQTHTAPAGTVTRLTMWLGPAVLSPS